MTERTTTGFDQQRLVARLEHLQTELARMGEEVDRMREMAALGELSAMIAHEVRNLMTPIVASAQRALREPGNADKARAALNRAMTGGTEAVGVADAILDLAVAAGAGVVTIERARLCDAVSQAIAGLGDHVCNAHIRRVGEQNVVVSMNPNALARVLANLISNAVKAAGGERATITLRAELRPDGSTWNTPQVVIEVSDNGPGVPRAIRSTLFGAFVREGEEGAVASLGKRADGAGLGLTICRRLVERAGGSIELVDSDEPGACFRLTLPAAE